MRYLVRAKVKPGREAALLRAVEARTLGAGSVAGGEYLRNMGDARLCDDGTARWVEVCFCAEPLEEERPYWEQFFELQRVQDAHPRKSAGTKPAKSRGRAPTAPAPSSWNGRCAAGAGGF